MCTINLGKKKVPNLKTFGVIETKEVPYIYIHHFKFNIWYFFHEKSRINFQVVCTSSICVLMIYERKKFPT